MDGHRPRAAALMSALLLHAALISEPDRIVEIRLTGGAR
jgi:hypothetical protein